ncbi:valine--tRNA ligase [Methylopila jiangsuensis]|uniref:Valine--tRNA ligase n=1 Tax=Methylopila jiangsuensis TaxID=586230 RepID=A0A9W6JF04_9HYPH|nr:valine--tRNA ligase [Methylopila jiangsuensis]MDR6285473.1 valyl-tRNA synthetase [Methylopila jiangsuensis]GLK75231.1 valine--tRNA ligase [Methylopila jiangsuensis]
MLDKTYAPADIEARIGARWEEVDAFRAGAGAEPGAEPYCIVIPPPNVTGSLHIGHALNNTLQDVLARFERMRGKDVLWQPGMDHAGIATQMVVERQLAQRGEPGRRDMGREKFVERVWEWKAESGGMIFKQLKRLGASCDWSRERFTMDEGLSRAVVRLFVRLHKDGLIYRDKRLVNWDPKLLTAISDIEVQSVEVKGHLWHLRYPVEGSDESIVVATTRPETMLGDAAVAVHPDDERYTHLIGKHVLLPLVGRRIPIVADSYSDPEKGTGAVKITPAHDFNDFEVGKRHGLKLINILTPDGAVTLAGNEDFLDGSAPDAETLALDGLDRAEARKRVVALLEERGLLVEIEPHVHQVPHGDRSGVVIEPYLTDQWYVDAAKLAVEAMAAVRDGRTRFIPENWSKTYFEWMENIQPWCVSRQLWWGHRIPAWFGPDGAIFVEETEAEALAAAEARYGAPTPLTRDEDVLDTWFSSALWPFSTMGWPDETPELAKYYPNAALVTGFDIIFFWVARMMMMGLYVMKEVPFRDVYIHALVRDEKGAKMSKSKGNVIDPIELVDAYGADALRFTLAAMAAQGRDIKLARARVEGYRNFATKLWNASRFAEMNGCAPAAGFDPATVKATLNRWILGEAEKATAEVTSALEAYRFDAAAAAVYRFVWNVVCDWYLELAKPVLQGEDQGPDAAETRAAVAYVLDLSVTLLHPFMPFVTEELWASRAGAAGRANVLALTRWPSLKGLGDAGSEAEIGWLVELVTELRSARAEMGVPVSAALPLVLVEADAALKARAERAAPTLSRIARVSGVSFAEAAPKGAIQLLVRGQIVAVPLEGVVDIAVEKDRLAKERAKAEGEIKRIDGKLANESFVARAPEEVVEGEREKRADYAARLAKIEAALRQLGGS